MAFGTNDVSPAGSIRCGAAASQVTGDPADEHPDSSAEEHWIEIKLVYHDNQEPLQGEEYCLELPDSTRVRGYLDQEGQAYVGGVANPGSCKVTYPRLERLGLLT